MTKVKDFLDFSDSLYSSVDLRAILVKLEGEWRNVFTLIKFSIDDFDQITQEQTNLQKKLGRIDDDNIKICMRSIDIKEIKPIFEDMNNGFIEFNGIKSIIVCKDYELYELEMGRSYSGFVGELSNYNTYRTSIRDNKNVLSQYASKIHNSLMKYGFTNSNDIFPAYFNIERYEYNENVIISSPIYCNILNMMLLTNFDFEANIKINYNLANETKIWLERILNERNNDRIIERRSYDAKKIVLTEEGKYLYLKISEKFDGLKYNENLKLIVYNEKIGIITDETLHIQFARDKTNKFNLAFSNFESYNILNKNLIDSINDVLFEQAVSWLFGLFNFKYLHLGKKGEILREHMTEIGSADILLYNPKSKFIYALDCTITPPSNDKIDRIRNTSEIIARKISGDVRPIIICSSSCSGAKKLGSELGVKILDKDELSVLLQLIENDELQPWLLSRMLDEIPPESD